MGRFIKRFLFIFKFWKFIPFLKDYFVSRNVPLRQKIIGIVLILGYIFIPFDIIPDYIPIVGIMDDALIVSFILERIVKMAPKNLKEKYDFVDKK
ncbi:YkvA family protein [Evansella sp. AB-rgal1]|uniref:YkvA family protein n=1 Tax=Evansella sp. AB-rgal1 TaxID=3242696 RepID=UPI00359E5425